MPGMAEDIIFMLAGTSWGAWQIICGLRHDEPERAWHRRTDLFLTALLIAVLIWTFV
jgi:hypothetical protein